MSGLEIRFARRVVCLVVLLCGQNSANFWRPVSLPSDPNDQYYEAFQNVSSPQDNAKKLMANFFHINPHNRVDRSRLSKRSGDYIEDIVVVMDGSGSVASCQFEKGKKALKHMMGLADKSKSDAKYAAVTFASSAQVNFKFKTYSIAANEILMIAYPAGGTNTQAGLAEAKNLFADPSSGRRVNARKMVFLLTDGQSNVQRQLTIPNADSLKNVGAQIYVVGIGSYISGIDELVKVASYPPEQFLFRVKTHQEFWEVIKLVIKQVSSGKYEIVNGQYEPPC